MRRAFVTVVLLLALAIPSAAQQSTVEEELRAELARMKEQLGRMEALLAKLAQERADAGSKPAAPEESGPMRVAPQPGPAAHRAPALLVPPALPLRDEGYRKNTPRFDVLLQARADFFEDTSRNDTFFLRKAEIAVKGRISPHVDYVLELDPVRPNDALRRTYIRLSRYSRLHVKLGLEKAPVGLEELSSSAQIPFVDRSEVNDRFASAEQFGAHLESRWDQWLFQFSVFNGNRRVFRDDNSSKDVAGRAVWAPRHWISLGASAWRGRAGIERSVRNRYNTEFKLGSNLTGFQSEFYRAQDGNVWSSAYYLGAHWAIPSRLPWMTHFQPVARYEFIGRSDRDANQELRLVTFGFGLLFAEHSSKFQVNYLKDVRNQPRRDELRAQYQVEF